MPVADVYIGGGKFWSQAIALGGVSLVVDSWKLPAEVAAPWDLDTDNLRTIRLTAGVGWMGSDTQFSIEYHHTWLGRTTRLEGAMFGFSAPSLSRRMKLTRSSSSKIAWCVKVGSISAALVRV